MGQVKKEIKELSKEAGGMSRAKSAAEAWLKTLRNLLEKEQYRVQQEDLDQDRFMCLDMTILNTPQNGIEIHAY